jgi:hypothetical protein
MYRNVLMTTGLVLLTTASAALGQDRVPHDPVPDRQYLPTKSQADQLLRWGDVGKCVAAQNREASLSYVTAKRGSPEATIAAKRLDPVFASCLAGSGIVRKANKSYRRAAVADALGIRLKQS